MNEQTRLPFDDLPEPVGEAAQVTTVEPPAHVGSADDLAAATHSKAALGRGH